MNNNIYVLYHAQCTDGTGAKFAALDGLEKLHAKDKVKPNIQAIAVNYNQPMPDMVPGSTVYIVDFSYKRAELLQLRTDHKKVVVIDHHKTAQEELKGLSDCIFDMNKSGAVLTWEYFHDIKKDPVPKVLLHVQDRDLWKFEMDRTKAVHAGLSLLAGKMQGWKQCCKSEISFNRLVMKGAAIEQYNSMKVEQATNKIRKIRWENYDVGVYNSPDLQSEIGNAIYSECREEDLSPKYHFGMVYCITNENKVLFSLRSRGDIDVSEIAKKYGGGGHKAAAGFSGTLDQLVSILNSTK